MAEFIVVSMSCADREQGERIAAALVEQRLAACVQIVGPVDSVYRWQGTVARAEEWLCIAKTRRERYDEVERAIRELHSYACPEIVATAIVAGSAGYLAWLAEQSSD